MDGYAPPARTISYFHLFRTTEWTILHTPPHTATHARLTRTRRAPASTRTPPHTTQICLGRAEPWANMPPILRPFGMGSYCNTLVSNI